MPQGAALRHQPKGTIRMRKILILGFAAVLAVLTLGSFTGSANAATTRTATFTAIQPANAFSQFDNVWTHTFAVNVDANGTFEAPAA